MDPITYVLSLIPNPYRQLVVALIGLVGFASVITGLLPAKAQGSKIAKVIRIIAAVVHANEDGTFKVPFTNIVISAAGATPPAKPGYARRRLLSALAGAALLCVLAPLALHGCAGSQTTINGQAQFDPNGSVAVGISVTISVAQVAVPAAIRAVEGPTNQAPLERAANVAADGLQQLSIGWAAYRHHPSGSALCQSEYYARTAADHVMDQLQIVRDLGQPIPPNAAAAVGEIAMIADMLPDACASSGPAARARMVEIVAQRLGAMSR